MCCADCSSPKVTNWVGWPSRKEGPYKMCEMCTWHSVKNRNATDYGPVTNPKPRLKFK